jgi:hypothetical protein
MWLLLTDAAFSIVQDWDDPGQVLVRSRDTAGLSRWFPGEAVIWLPSADYPHRVRITRERLGLFLAAAAERITYFNFKDAVTDTHRHDWYLQVYNAWWEAHRD